MTNLRIAAVFAALYLFAIPASAQEPVPAAEVVVAETLVEAVEPEIKLLISDLLGHLRAGGEFIGEQTPLLFEEIILWGIVSRIPWMLVGVMVLYSGLLVQRWGSSVEGAEKEIAYICCTGVFAISAFLILPNLFYMLKPLAAPRLYLIEQLVRMAG